MNELPTPELHTPEPSRPNPHRPNPHRPAVLSAVVLLLLAGCAESAKQAPSSESVSAYWPDPEATGRRDFPRGHPSQLGGPAETLADAGATDAGPAADAAGLTGGTGLSGVGLDGAGDEEPVEGPTDRLDDEPPALPDPEPEPEPQPVCAADTKETCPTACGTLGTRYCQEGTWTACLGPKEKCNGADDDCNGLVDDGVLNECGFCGPVPEEVCNGFDDDCDKIVDEGCDAEPDPAVPDPPKQGEETCNGVDDDGDGQVDEGVTNACGGCGSAPEEVCNGADDDCDGLVDEGVTNACGDCGPVPTEVCNGVDDDCDGLVDETCGQVFEIPFQGDCMTLYCPDQLPFPVAGNIIMAGNDKKGCVASQPTSQAFYLQEGDDCSSGGIIGGTITCSAVPQDGLKEGTCTVNKDDVWFVNKIKNCPD